MKRQDRLSPRLYAWWDNVLAGETDAPHPEHGDKIRVNLRGSRLALSGEVPTKKELDELVGQARSRIGRGVDHVDTAHLRVADKRERSGILDQTLVAAYIDRATAELADKLIHQHARIEPKAHAIVDRTNARRVDELLPPDIARDAHRRIDKGNALLIQRVDETDAFKFRALMEEETRSIWTLAAPPDLAKRV